MEMERVGVWLAAIVTLGIYSYLWRENRFYRLLLHLMIGLGVGYNFVITWKQVLAPLWWQPMVAGFAAIGQGFAPGSAQALWLLVGLLGLLWYFQLSRRYFWLARIVIGLMLGASAGVVFKQQLLLNMPQFADSLRPLLARADGSPLVSDSPAPFSLAMSLNNLIFVATLVCVMVYFLFSFEHRSKPVRGAARAGRWLLMLSFGAFFGNTVMTRLAVFLERVEFLLRDWLRLI